LALIPYCPGPQYSSSLAGGLEFQTAAPLLVIGYTVEEPSATSGPPDACALARSLACPMSAAPATPPVVSMNFRLDTPFDRVGFGSSAIARGQTEVIDLVFQFLYFRTI
jgi:hypothetical protein